MGFPYYYSTLSYKSHDPPLARVVWLHFSMRSEDVVLEASLNVVRKLEAWRTNVFQRTHVRLFAASEAMMMHHGRALIAGALEVCYFLMRVKEACRKKA